VQLRDAASGELRRALNGHAAKVTCLAFSPDGKLLAAGGRDKTIRLWDPASGAEVRAIASHAHAVAFSPDGKLIASADYDRTVHLWDPATGKEVAELNGHKAAVSRRGLFAGRQDAGQRR